MGTAAFLNSRAHAVPANATPVLEAYPPVKALAISTTVASAGTVATIYVPTAGTRFRFHSAFLTPSAADTVFLRSVASAVFQVNGRGAANTPFQIDAPPGGVRAASNNAALVLDAGAGGTIVTGTIFLSEEA